MNQSLINNVSFDRVGLTGLHGWVNGRNKPRPFYERRFEFGSLSHFREGEMWFWLPGGKRSIVQAPCFILMLPGDLHGYGCHRGIFLEDCLAFKGRTMDDYRNKGWLKSGLYQASSQRLLLPIIEAMQRPDEKSQTQFSARLESLLLDLEPLQNSGRSKNSEDRILTLITEMEEDCSFPKEISELANRVALSPSQFRKCFLSVTGLTPQVFQEKLRLGQAAQWLCRDKMKVCEVAEAFHFVDAYHFSRRFKRHFGVSPKVYQQSFARK